MSSDTCSIDELCINTIRTLAMDAVQAANSGHPGAPMGLAATAYTLWTRVLKHNPKDPAWPDRDRFVLSGGHASMLLYSLLHLTGYDLSLDDLKQFRQWGSKTPGHPEFGHTPGVETTTGPLGQGVANAVGMAMAERHLAARFNRPGHNIVDHYTYVICGDGDLMEGVSAEAASMAGHLGLGKLICVYDDNKITIEGSTDIAFTENVARRFEAYGWQTIAVADGNDVDAIEAALKAGRAESQKPTLILVRTHIAYGSPNKQDSEAAHGAPLGVEEVCLTKRNLGCPDDQVFCIPDQTRDIFTKSIDEGSQAQAQWESAFETYRQAYPELAGQWAVALAGRLAEGWDAALPEFGSDGGPLATRAASGQALNALATGVPELIGGSADLAPSNKTFLNESHEFQKDAYDGRNIRFGVREHAMGAVMAGMALHRGVRPYGGTFLVFADYVRPAIRLASLMKVPVIYVFTHDSIAVGEDGPTHQPVEHVAALRAIPGLTVLRPADARETAAAWQRALQISDGPVALILSRQKLPLLDISAEEIREGVSNGAYVVADAGSDPEVILMATGSEVSLAIAAHKELSQKGVAARVVSMPSWELYEKAPQAYKDQVLPPAIKARIAVEAGISLGWHRYIGDNGEIIAMESFGASAPGGVLMEKFGFTATAVVERTLKVLGR